MLRIRWLTNAAAAKKYYAAALYYADQPGEWLGRGAAMLGLSGEVATGDFFALCDNLDPRSGMPLTTHTRDGRRVGVDFNFNAPKSVGIVRELAGDDHKGDDRIETAHREAVAYAMELVEADMRGRIRVGGKNEDRVTGNLVAMRLTHRDTRINADDFMPDMSLHDHVVVINATYDAVEQKWKAAQIGPIKHDGPYYEAIYHNRLATNLRDIGYGIRRKGKSFEIAGISEEMIRTFSRRRATIDKVANELGIASAAGRDVLGASTRLGKSNEVTDDLNGYWLSRLSDAERKGLTQLIGKPSYEADEPGSIRHAIGHMFERSSVVDERRLYEAAIRYGIGSVTPDGIQAEAKRQGVLVRDGHATTRDVLAEERHVIEFAKEGRGTMLSLGSNGHRNEFSANYSTLSPEQRAICRHVWDSSDQVVLIRGVAGTGKTRTMRAAIDGINKQVAVLAPSAEASRGVLRSADGGGFQDADTVARFLIDATMQEKTRGGVIWVDEAGLLGIRQVAQLFNVAKQLDARVILQGDKRQHGSVERGATLRVLEEFAGLPVAELRNIRRQRGQYKSAVESLSRGDMLEGYDRLAKMGWVNHADSHAPLVDDYLDALGARKSVLVVAPTHAEGDEVTATLRTALKQRGMIGNEDRLVERLVPLGWTEAERADPASYEGTEIVQFHRQSGPYKAGQRVHSLDFRLGRSHPAHYAVYGRDRLPLSRGDVIRITANGKDKSGRHKLNNGKEYTLKGFTSSGDLVLTNGWIVAKDFGHLSHGYVATSYAAQGKTVKRVLIAMGQESLPAIHAEQFYVSVSRGREMATIYSDLPADRLREAIQKAHGRKSATELMGQSRPRIRTKRKASMQCFIKRVADVYRQLRLRATRVMSLVEKQREMANER